MYCRRRPRSPSSAKNSFTAASCSAHVCNWFMRVAERRRPGQPLGVPGDVLARDAHAGVLAVERVQIVQMRDEHAMDLLDFGRRQMLAGLEVVR